MGRLAMLGGDRAVDRSPGPPRWPVVGDAERAAVLGVLESGHYTAVGRDGNELTELEREWAARCGVAHCVSVANGTAALAMCLAAAGVGPGDEVIVPALSFVATAMAALHIGAVPVFVDIDLVTFNIDPAAIAAAVTPRTRAIIPVHLHGLPAELAEIVAIAEPYGIAVIEDAAQAHGAIYHGRPVGSWGVSAAFSLNVSKNLPTCGEGGLITTDDAETGRRLKLLRQFGERLDDSGPRQYTSLVAGWNQKLSAANAAFTRAQLQRFDAADAARAANVGTFLDRIGKLPGVIVPTCPNDRTHAWHILRLRFDAAQAGLTVQSGPFRAVVQRALRAEGVPVQQYQSRALPDQPMFTDPVPGQWLRGIPVTSRVAGSYAVTRSVISESVTLQRVHLSPDAAPLLDSYAAAFEKVWDHLEVIGRAARDLPYRPPWHMN